MARPRKAEDPEAFPTPCARCGGHYQLTVTWPDGRLCVSCRMAAMRTVGTCACGHAGILPCRIDGEPACRDCSGVRVNIDCRRCGAEAELYRDKLCQRCVLEDLVDAALINPATGAMAPQVVPIAEAIMHMKRANSGLTWIRQAHVEAFLKDLAMHHDVSHDVLDEMPPSRTRDFVRGLLVAHEALPTRDELIVRFTAWAAAAEKRLTDEHHRNIIKKYVAWKHLRHMRDISPIEEGTFLRAKQATTVAIALCNWLTAKGFSIEELTQRDLDAWLAAGTTTRLLATRFLAWTRSARITDATLKVPRHRRGTAPRLPHSAQRDALDQALDAKGFTPRDRLAAVLILAFAQPIQRIVEMTWDDIKITDDVVVLTLGEFPINLTAPLDDAMRNLALAPGHAQTATHPSSPWVFRGASPGAHLSAMSLRQRLRPTFSALAARLGTITELARETPVAIVAEALGYTPATIERHAAAAGVDYGNYVAALKGGTSWC